MLTGYASVFVLFVRLFLNVEGCMWKGRIGERGEGTVSGRGKVRRGGGGWEEEDREGERGGDRKWRF